MTRLTMMQLLARRRAIALHLSTSTPDARTILAPPEVGLYTYLRYSKEYLRYSKYYPEYVLYNRVVICKYYPLIGL
jgi:hypothetical protein